MKDPRTENMSIRNPNKHQVFGSGDLKQKMVSKRKRKNTTLNLKFKSPGAWHFLPTTFSSNAKPTF